MARKKPMTHTEIARLGGYACAKSLSPEVRRRNARAAVRIRWERYRELQRPKDLDRLITELRARLQELEASRNAETESAP